MKPQKGSPLDYGSEFHNISGITKLLIHREDKDRIVYITQKGSRYHLSPKEEATRKTDLEAMILRGNHKVDKSGLNVAEMDQ